MSGKDAMDFLIFTQATPWLEEPHFLADTFPDLPQGGWSLRIPCKNSPSTRCLFTQHCVDVFVSYKGRSCTLHPGHPTGLAHRSVWLMLAERMNFMLWGYISLRLKGLHSTERDKHWISLTRGIQKPQHTTKHNKKEERLTIQRRN